VKIPPVIQQTIDRVMHLPPVVRLMEILAVYNTAGGGLLAAGLAYGALFAALTGLLFAVGLVGFFVNDSAAREQIVAQITASVPPLQPIVRDGLLSIASHAGAFSILGLVGLGWGASQFYGSVDTAFGRLFQRIPERSPIDRIGRGIVSVLIIVAGLAAGIVTSGMQAALATGLPNGTAGDATRTVMAVGYPIVTVLIVIAAVGVIYRLVPNTHVPWRVLGPPAVLAGLVIAALTELFVFLAPRLVGSLAVFGGFAAVFAALTWLNWAFQALLIGGAWTRERMPERSPALGPQVSELRPSPDVAGRTGPSAARPSGAPEPMAIRSEIPPAD
jgi:membrane protein